MEQEDKELLLKDLCARLPYGVIVRHADPLVDNDGNETGEFWYKRGYLCDITTLDDMTTTIIESEGSDEEGYEHICFLEKTVPYLRPMSSMTEEDNLSLSKYVGCSIRVKYGEIYFPIIEDNTTDKWGKVFEWLNRNMFDYRGLIPMKLAIEAPEGMYNN